MFKNTQNRDFFVTNGSLVSLGTSPHGYDNPRFLSPCGRGLRRGVRGVYIKYFRYYNYT